MNTYKVTMLSSLKSITILILNVMHLLSSSLSNTEIYSVEKLRF